MQINLDGDPSVYVKKSGQADFYLKIGYVGSLKRKKKFLPTAVLDYIFIYLQIKH